jgi:hypothetical protein
MIHLRKNKVGDCRISGNVSRKTQLRMFISWALPAFCTIAAAGTPAYAVGVDAATASPKALTSSSSLWGADDDKSYKRLLQATETEVQTAATTEEVHDDHDHTEAEEEMGHDDHKDELIDIDHAEVSCSLPHLMHLFSCHQLVCIDFPSPFPFLAPI